MFVAFVGNPVRDILLVIQLEQIKVGSRKIGEIIKKQQTNKNI